MQNRAGLILRTSFTATVLVIVALLSACGEKPASKASSLGQETEASQAGTGAEKSSGGIPNQASTPVIGAFIQNSEIWTKSFEQGAQLALGASPAPSFDLKFFDVVQGVSPDAAGLKALIENAKVPAFLYWSTDDVRNVAPFLDSSDIVGLVSGEVDKSLVRLGASIFGFGYSNELTFKQLAKFAGNTLKSYRFAVITGQDPHFQRQSAVFIEESKSLGNTIVFQENGAGDSTNFEHLIARAGKENCDTIFAVLPAPAQIKFIKSVRAHKFRGKILVGDSLFANDLATLGPDAEGIYMTQAWSDDAELRSLYLNKYGNTPDGVTLGFTALGYDTVKCLLGVGKPIDAAAIRYSFLSTSCEGLTGKTQFTGERIAQRRKKILTVRSGQLELGE